MSNQNTLGPRTPVLGNKLYDALKWVAQIGLPAAGALYFGLASIWGLPAAEQVIGTVTVVDTFLGALLALSTKQYNNSDAKYDGELLIDMQDPDEKSVIQFREEVSDIAKRDSIELKVNEPPKLSDSQ